MFIKCKYCSRPVPSDGDHMENCEYTNYDEVNGILYCYSCGNSKNDCQFSNSQLKKDARARCTNCVNNSIFGRYEPYVHLYQPTYHDISLDSKDSQLMYYIGQTDYEKVKSLLEDEANPNYIRQKLEYINGEYVNLYNEDGSEVPENDPAQPDKPLKLCIFRLSDCLLTDEESGNIIKIAKLLISKGANIAGAKYLYELRYGKINNPDDINDIHFAEMARLLKP